MSATVRADWGAVTVGQYQALEVLRREPVEILAALDAYWDAVHDVNPLRGDAPTRLTPAGVETLERLCEMRRSSDEHVQIQASRELIRMLGFMTVPNVCRALNARQVAPDPSPAYDAAVERLIWAARAVERVQHTGRHGDGRDAEAAAALTDARRALAGAIRVQVEAAR